MNQVGEFCRMHSHIARCDCDPHCNACFNNWGPVRKNCCRCCAGIKKEYLQGHTLNLALWLGLHQLRNPQ